MTNKQFIPILFPAAMTLALSVSPALFAEPSPLSKPDSPVPASAPGTLSNSKPTQGEGEKAPVQNRASAVPEFTLPEVVITGENELTIGAQRLEQKENDVTLGSHDLAGLDRALNDLPGLDKTLTALNAGDQANPRNTAFLLKAGGGSPKTWGGWGLFGEELKDFQFTASGNYSTWGGEAAGAGFDGDTRYGGRLEASIFPEAVDGFLLSAEWKGLDAELPYQQSVMEGRRGLDLDGAWRMNLSDRLRSELRFSHRTTWLTYWDGALTDGSAQELDARYGVSMENFGPVLEKIGLDAGGRHAVSSIPGAVVPDYDYGWVDAKATLRLLENISIDLKLAGQAGSGPDLPLKAFPEASVDWRLSENTRAGLHWRTGREIEGFYGLYAGTEHVDPAGGFPVPSETMDEWGARLDRRLGENVILNLSGTTTRTGNYHQWSDIDALSPIFIQGYSTLPVVEIDRASAGVQWNFQKYWTAAAAYDLTRGLNLSNDGRVLTGIPDHQGTLSVTRDDGRLETRLTLTAVSSRHAFESIPGDLGWYFTAGVNLAYHLTGSVSLWIDADNLLGEDYQLQPGYFEPRYHVRGGVELAI